MPNSPRRDRVIRRIKVGLIAFVVFLALGIAGIWLLYDHLIQALDIRNYASFAELPVYQWARVELSAQTSCSDGSRYHSYARRGESDKLIIHFAGGGAAWDGETASQPLELTNLNGYYIASIPEIVRALLSGIFQSDKPENPFHDWNVVYIPYCTADFDIGNVIREYTSPTGKAINFHHSGRQNVTEALDWVYKTFDAPPKLLVSGDSAGGFASIFWITPIATHYTASAIYQLADGVYLDSPLWNTIVNDTWQADAVNQWGFTVTDDLAASAYLAHLGQPLPKVTYMHINTLYDEMLLRFEAKLNNVPNDAQFHAQWSQRMVASMKRLSESGLKYFYFVTDYGLDSTKGTTPHTSISSPLFFQIEEGNTPLTEWVRRAVIEDQPFSVGAHFLPN